MFKLAVAAGAGAAMAGRHHTTGTFTEEEFTHLGAAKATEKVSFSAALPWSNFEVLDAKLADISNPSSMNYGQWMTQHEVNTLTAPDATKRAEAAAALASAGAECVDFPHSLRCTMPVAAANKLFATEFSAFEQTSKGMRRVVRVHPDTAFAFPEALRGRVDFFTNLVDFPTVKRRNGVMHTAGEGQLASSSLRGSKGAAAGTDYTVVPETLSLMYGAGGNATYNALSTQAPAEFQKDASYNPKDLARFQVATGVQRWNVTTRVGPYAPANPDLEATLDEQYIGSTGPGNNNWYWTETEWQYEFVENIAAKPDSGVPSVFSISWGWSEADQCTIDQGGPCADGNDANSAAYVSTTNQGFAAAGARGISILVSSGDSGAHGRTDPDCSSPKTRPDWPTASPYILSVGATQLKDSTPVTAPTSAVCKTKPAAFPAACAGGGTEIVASPATGALIASGGGFSNVAATPAWQSAAVASYLTSGAVLPPKPTDFNATSRAYPDVAALGHQVAIMAADAWTIVDGTSCSTPMFAGIIGTANAQRLAAGKKVLGFLPPSIYTVAASTPAAFTDVTSGDNKCTEDGCAATCTGFGATKGWDAVTGWGTPNVKELVAALVAL